MEHTEFVPKTAGEIGETLLILKLLLDDAIFDVMDIPAGTVRRNAHVAAAHLWGARKVTATSLQLLKIYPDDVQSIIREIRLSLKAYHSMYTRLAMTCAEDLLGEFAPVTLPASSSQNGGGQ